MNEAMGPLLRRQRDLLHLTQEEVARQAGLTRSWLKKLEAGQVRHPHITWLQRLEPVLQLERGRLLRLAGYDPTFSGPVAVRTEVEDIRMKARLLARFSADIISYVDELEARLGTDGHDGNGRSDGTEPGVRTRAAIRECETALAS